MARRTRFWDGKEAEFMLTQLKQLDIFSDLLTCSLTSKQYTCIWYDRSTGNSPILTRWKSAYRHLSNWRPHTSVKSISIPCLCPAKRATTIAQLLTACKPTDCDAHTNNPIPSLLPLLFVWLLYRHCVCARIATLSGYQDMSVCSRVNISPLCRASFVMRLM